MPLFTDTIAEIGAVARPIESPASYDELIEQAGNAHVVLIGEASHGTQEFYATRAELTRRLIVEKGFRAVLCEADLAGQLPGSPVRHRTQRGSGCGRGFARLPAFSGLDVA